MSYDPDYRQPANWDWNMTIPREPKKKGRVGRPRATSKPTHPSKPKCPRVGEDGRTRNQEFRDMVVYMELNGWNKKSIAWELGVDRKYVHTVLGHARKDDAGKKAGMCSATLILLMRRVYKNLPPFKRDHTAALKRQKELEEFGPDLM